MVDRDTITKIGFVASAVILVLWVVYGNVSWNFYNSLTDWGGVKFLGENFVGFENYSELIFGDGLANRVFEKALVNTIILTGVFVSAGVALGLGLAVLLDLGVKGSGVFQWIFFVPFGFSFAISGNLWRWAFDPTNGTINEIFELFRLDFLQQPWTSSSDQALYCIALAYLWQFSGFAAVIFYAGMKRVSKRQLEAAIIDGASTFKKYWKIVIPQLRGATMTVLAIYLFYALRVFDLIYIITGGGPGWKSTEVLATSMYDWAFNRNWWARASSLGAIMFVIAIIIVIPFLYHLIIKEE
ncbi:MAG: carbohydrate ABC transporter permease [Candidatus Hadarchaeota archaeon]